MTNVIPFPTPGTPRAPSPYPTHAVVPLDDFAMLTELALAMADHVHTVPRWHESGITRAALVREILEVTARVRFSLESYGIGEGNR
jgi:hypothetical protein